MDIKTEDIFIKKANAGLAACGITEYDEARLREIVSLADDAVPLLEPERYDIRVSDTGSGQIIISFVVEDITINRSNAAPFLTLVSAASLVRFTHENNGDSLCVSMFFGLK